ncbi:MAG: hypothetical protein LBQ40_00460 [Clostridiales bacterium]|jgi:hypothetical protein|nr:hypothetical protein [Clostridiales bacterium]
MNPDFTHYDPFIESKEEKAKKRKIRIAIMDSLLATIDVARKQGCDKNFKTILRLYKELQRELKRY